MRHHHCLRRAQAAPDANGSGRQYSAAGAHERGRVLHRAVSHAFRGKNQPLSLRQNGHSDHRPAAASRRSQCRSLRNPGKKDSQRVRNPDLGSRDEGGRTRIDGAGGLPLPRKRRGGWARRRPHRARCDQERTVVLRPQISPGYPRPPPELPGAYQRHKEPHRRGGRRAQGRRSRSEAVQAEDRRVSEGPFRSEGEEAGGGEPRAKIEREVRQDPPQVPLPVQAPKDVRPGRRHRVRRRHPPRGASQGVS
mmetsp:Transcript_546/g.922  ORF Transcript_546/g.922 Transcript_546/m.922 type:complete len:250 (+) Transcript_546:1401-2150(+)